MPGTLYIVATPIGNLEDITIRAIRVMREVDLILAEDTRVTGVLLKHYDIPARNASSIADAGGDKPILSYHQHSDESKKLQILAQILSGKNVALVSDAGTPGISDPGNELIDFILERSDRIPIIPVPGASAITTALSACGFNVSKFVFIGFLPKKKRTKLFKWLVDGEISFAFYESPNRILKTLDVLAENFGGEKRIFIGRELTKLYETLYRGTISEVKLQLGKEKVRGEIVVVVEQS